MKIVPLVGWVSIGTGVVLCVPAVAQIQPGNENKRCSAECEVNGEMVEIGYINCNASQSCCTTVDCVESRFAADCCGSGESCSQGFDPNTGAPTAACVVEQ